MKKKQNNSWVKVYRKMIDNPIYKSSSGLRVWLHCLLSATHTKHKIEFAGKEIELKVGEFIYGRYQWEKITRISPNTIESWINKLVKRNMIYVERRVRGYGSILGISKWGDYQTQRAIKRANNERMVSEWRANGEYNKDNKDKKDKKKKDTTKVVSRRKPYGNERIDYLLKIFRRDIDQPPVDKYPRRVAWAFVQNIQFSYKKKTGKDVTDEKFNSIADWLFGKYTEKDFAENTYKLETVRLHSKAFLEKTLEGGGKNG